MTIDELIAKLEAASEGSRELDEEIAAVAAGAILERQEGGRAAYHRDGHWIGVLVLNYTTSLDAALTLVPPHMDVSLQDRYDGALGAHIFLFGPSAPSMSDIKLWARAHLEGDDPRLLRPLAVCVATLKARKVQP